MRLSTEEEEYRHLFIALRINNIGVVAMEIINSNDLRRTVLMISDGKTDLSDLKCLLEKNYKVNYINHDKEDFSDIVREAENISAAIVCVKDVAANDYAMFNYVKDDYHFSSVPLIIYCDDPSDLEVVNGCFERGASEVIAPPLYETIVYKRIENAIRLKESRTFYEIEKMLKELPSNIYLKDDKGRYIFATHYWHHLEHGGDSDWSIRGKTDVEIRKDKDNALKAMESDREIISTGVGKNYIIEVNEDDVREYLQIIKEPVRDEKGKVIGIIALINDVTEREMLRMKLEESAHIDELTGVRNKNCYTVEVERLNKEIDDNKANFGIVMIDLNNLKIINDTYGHELGNVAIVKLCRHICFIFKNFPVFRIGGDEFVVLLEGKGLDNAGKLLDRFRRSMVNFKNDMKVEPWERVTAAIGMAIYDKCRDNSVTDVFNRADMDMYECKRRMHGESN